NAVGSEFGDTITGTGGRNALHGGYGSDSINALGGNDLVDGGLGQDALDGGTGRDTLSIEWRAPDGVKVDLGQGKAWDHPSMAYYYKTVSNIENIAGSGGPDLLIGDSRPNVIDGGDGDDTLQGAGGADVLLGGPGADRVGFQAAPRGVSVDLGAGAAVGEGADVFAEVEGAWGSRYDDTIVGDDGPNYLSGDEGEDVLIGLGGDDELLGGDAPDFLDGGPGNDTLNGMQASDYLLGGPGDDKVNGAGAKTVDIFEMRDVASFEESTQPVVVQFGDSSDNATATGEGTDRLTDIAIVVGTPFADRMRARGNSAVLVGLEGNDTLTGNYLVGGPGDDRLDGFAVGSEWDSGDETADFYDAPGPVEADLGAGWATGEGDDTLIGIARAVGGEFDDRLTGSSAGNRLYGLGGDDRLYGLDGDDWLWGDQGSDYLSGASGTDRCVDGESLSSCEYTYTTEEHDTPTPAARMGWGRAPAWSDWVASPVSRLLWGEPSAAPPRLRPAAR
ncbi:MAG: hypothetical protein H6Q11_557, partial [Acidobacteria bacterium]|nr:hypothetical protein [Acidobacteriota bacterium]